jgi:hypothetical protein
MKIRQAKKIWGRANRGRKSNSYFYRIKKATYAKAVARAVGCMYAKATRIFSKRPKEDGE